MSRTLLTPLVTTLALLAISASAQGDGTLLDAILVTDPDEAAAADTGPATSTTDRVTLQGQYQGAGIATVLNGFAGVATETVAGDPAIAVNIRGLTGSGRVVVTIDGARQNFARSGHGANGTFVADPEMLRSMSVSRGPSGAGAATGAIGGTLALHTVTAEDLIPQGQMSGGEAVLRFGTLTDEPTAHLAWATELTDQAEALFAYTATNPGNYHAGDSTLVHAENDSQSLLAKLSFAPSDSQKLTLTLSQIRTDYLDGFTSAIYRDNHLVTETVLLDYGMGSAGDIWTADATLYHTTTKVEQQLLDDAFAPDGPARSYQTTTTGLRVTGNGDLPLGNLDNTVTLVLDGFRDGVTTDDPTLPGGSLTPSGNRDVWSLLVQDKLEVIPGTSATFGLRHDSYRLSSDDGSVDGSQLSPSLTLAQEVGPMTLFATLARAYRPPTLSEALVNGQHPEPANFYIRPNPALLPETSVTREIGATVSKTGLLTSDDTFTGQISSFQNNVTDYVGLVRKGGLFDGYYQYDNIDHVTIRGVEVELAYDAGFAFGSLAGQVTTGTDQATGSDLSGVAPNRLVLTEGLRSQDRLTEYGLRLTNVAARADATLSSAAWQTVDVFATRQIGDKGSFGLALNNITDATYTTYLATQPSPGFNVTASLSLKF